MATRTLTGVVERIKALAVDVREYPEARNAFRRVLELLAAVDTGTAADVIAATAPPTLHALPKDWPIIPADMDEREKQELVRSMMPEFEAEGA